MKKLLSLMLILCLLPVAALAEEDEDGDILVTLPDGSTFFFTPPEDSLWVTRESAPARFLNLGMDYREVYPFMEEYDVYALLYDEEVNSEIQVLAYENVDVDFADLTDFGEAMLLERWSYSYTDWGYDVLDCEIYRAPEGHVFVRTLMTIPYEDGMVDYVVEYATVRGGWEVSICLFSYLDGIVQEQVDLVEALADSLWIMPVQ